MDALAASEGQLVNGDTRNTKIVVCLILAMTAGAGILLWLEPNRGSTAGLSPLTAIGGVPIEEVVIAYATPEDLRKLGGNWRALGADCLICSDGQCYGQPDGPRVRLVVAGSESDELPAAQEESLLGALASLTQARRGTPVRVGLHPDSDASRKPELPPQAHDLRDLLVLKGMVE